MDMPDRSNSACDEYNLQVLQSLPESEPSYDLPFSLLDGEHVSHCGHCVDGMIVLTKYRIYLQIGDLQHHIPLGLLETVEHRELFFLQIGCKDARTYRCTFENNDSALDWYNRILKAIEPPKQLNQLFAFTHFQAHMKDKLKNDENFQCHQNYVFDKRLFKSEMARLQFGGDSWRISDVNINYKLCPTYPPYLLVPSCINDETLESVAKFRSSRRIPAVVWRHVKNGAVIARCSQPEVGWLGWRSNEDEDLIKAISEACNFHWNHKSSDKESNLSHSPNSLHSTECLHIPPEVQQDKKVLIMDARSYTTAVANRARGGGCECPEYYPNCEIQFMNLANIHSIRKSFHALRQLCTSSADQPNWFSQLEGTRWLLHMSGLMKAAVTLVTAVERDARPVMVHCSDGWDRTPQIVALSELLLDPYYRTIDGFRILIEREWLAFGHKFADRCGHTGGSEDPNERCPVFLQWLDCVHQLHKQFSCAFEFSHTYLVKLAQHTYSNLFGTFLCNTQQERKLKMVYDNTFSVWDFLNSARFKNHLYAPGSNICNSSRVLWPQCNVRDLHLWTEVYLGSLEANSSSTDGGSGACPGPPRSSPHHMTKTRSYGDLINTTENAPGHLRRSSDPSINNTEKKLSVLIKDPEPTQPPTTTQEPVAAPVTAAAVPQANGTQTPPISVQNNFLSNGGGPPSDGTTPDESADDLFDSPTDHFEDRDVRIDKSSPYINVKRTVFGYNRSGEVVDFLQQHGDNVINGDKTDGQCDAAVTAGSDVANDLQSAYDSPALVAAVAAEAGGIPICRPAGSVASRSPLFASGAGVGDEGVATCCAGDEYDSGCTTPERSESKSENTVCDISAMMMGAVRSVETSTDTLVSDNVSSSFKEANGFEKLHVPVEPIENGLQFEFDGLDEPSKSPLPPPSRSRTSSSSEWDNCMQTIARPTSYSYPLGDDGLMPLRSVVQERLQEIIDENKRKLDMLQKELHIYRLKLAEQVCHKCNYSKLEKLDDNVSVVESVGSAGEGQASAVESLRSDMSWEAIEETSSCADYPGTLWVPDHAVSRCMGCNAKFWVGNRKHHCRNCGKIFCADCSEKSTPLPSEQLYNPVRVCITCYSTITREVPDQCKNYQTQTTNSNPQIAASSN